MKKESTIIDGYINDLMKANKCNLCDGVGETECDNCGGIGWIPITPHDVEMIMMKYQREQVNPLEATIAQLREERLLHLNNIKEICLKELIYPLSHGIKSRGAAMIIDDYIKENEF